MPRAPRGKKTEVAETTEETVKEKAPARRRRRSSAALSAEAAGFRVLPLLPIRDQVYFPHMIFPLLVGRERSVRALDEAIKHDRQIILVAQKQVNTEDPEPEELFR